MCMACIAPAREERVGKGEEEEAPVSETEEKNKALVRWWFEEVWVKGNVAAVDEFMARRLRGVIPSLLGCRLAPRASSRRSPCTTRPSPT